MEPNPKVIGSRISQKMIFVFAILGLSFSIFECDMYNNITNYYICA